MLAKSASDTPRISGGKAGPTSILRPFFFAAWVRITRASALRRKTGASKSGLCRFFRRRCAGCRIDSGSAAFAVCIKEMGRDVFGNGRRIDETLERFVFEKTVLNTYRGARSAQVRFAVGKVYDEKEGV